MGSGAEVRFAALELPAIHGQAGEQHARLEAALRQAPVADVVLLPEAAITGYVSPSLDFDLRSFAEPLGGATFERVAALAAATRTAIVFPLIEADGQRTYNAIVGVDATGQRILHYRKRHPWYPETWAAPGEEAHTRILVKGVRVTAAICFDIHFMVAEAADTLRWADVLLFPSAWVDDGHEDARSSLLQTLADDFDVVVVNANWGPGLPRIRGQGRSRIVRPRAAELGAMDARGLVVGTVDPRRGGDVTPGAGT